MTLTLKVAFDAGFLQNKAGYLAYTAAQFPIDHCQTVVRKFS